MKRVKLVLVGISSLGLLLLGACGSGNQSTSNVPSSAPAKVETQSSKKNHSEPSQGGQVVESGPYHMEFVVAKEPNGTHLDFYLQNGDNHAPK
jgi:hypothetical protein